VLTALAALWPPAPASAEKLSNEQGLTRWAYAYQRVRARVSPSGRARTVTRLRYSTEDGKPEIYLALRDHRDRQGRVWIQVRLPMRPNGRKGWVLEKALGPLHTVHTQLRVNRRTLRATLYYRRKKEWSAPVGVGAPSTPTPGGRFYIREILDGFKLGTIYGPLAFGTSAYSVLSDWPGGGVVGIHGTNQPHLIPGRPSHGCIRMKNRDILELADLMPLGTPLRIL
jgi:L,D-transpeptidase catalytic domain